MIGLSVLIIHVSLCLCVWARLYFIRARVLKPGRPSESSMLSTMTRNQINGHHNGTPLQTRNATTMNQINKIWDSSGKAYCIFGLFHLLFIATLHDCASVKENESIQVNQ